MDPVALMEMMENPPPDTGEGSPKDPSWWPPTGLGEMGQDLNSIHAANATCAAFHADVAAKHAAQLAQWVQYLWNQVTSLEHKIVELEDWKKKTLDDMSRLRLEHKQLRRKLMPDGDSEESGMSSVKSLPLLLADQLDSGESTSSRASKKKAASPSSTPFSSSPSSVRPPPGLMIPADVGRDNGAKRVSFAPPLEPPPPAPTSPMSPDGSGDMTPFRSVSELSLTHSESGSFGSEASPTSTGALEKSAPEGVHVNPTLVDGVACENAEWRIGHLSTKLRGCMGRPLVSPSFSAWGLEDLRLMVFPDGKEIAKGPRSRRQKELYAKKVSEGPLDGCLKLKVPDCPAPHILEYYLKIGDVRKGPFKHNFAESTVNGCVDFGIDWLQQVDADQSLTVGVEILRAGAAIRAFAEGIEAPPGLQN